MVVNSYSFILAIFITSLLTFYMTVIKMAKILMYIYYAKETKKGKKTQTSFNCILRHDKKMKCSHWSEANGIVHRL